MIYLNNAATTYPKPDAVVSAVKRYVDMPQMELSRAVYKASEDDVIKGCRQAIAKLFNVDDPNTIAFTSSATHAMNMVVRGLELSGGHVITTMVEHSSTLRPLMRRQDDDVAVTIVECDENGSVSIDSIKQHIRPNTKAFLVNHSSNIVNAMINLEALSDLAYEEDITLVVDASQSAGCVPIDLKKLHIDVLVFTGHKSLYGITGTGGMYVRDGLFVEPLIMGGTGINSDLLYQTEARPAFFESGTQNFLGMAALRAGVAFVLRTGIKAMNDKKERLFYKVTDRLQEYPEIITYGKLDFCAPLISFNVKGIHPMDVGRMLNDSYDIVVRTGLMCAPLIHKYIGSDPLGLVRMSFSYFTTEAEIDQFLEAVDMLVKEMRQNRFQSVTSKDVTSCY